MSYILQLKESDSREGVGLLNVTAISFDNRLSLRNPVTRDSFRAILSRRGKTLLDNHSVFCYGVFRFRSDRGDQGGGVCGAVRNHFCRDGAFPRVFPAG